MNHGQKRGKQSKSNLVISTVFLLSVCISLTTSALPQDTHKHSRPANPAVWERGDRDSWQEPEKAMDIIGIKAGMIVGEAGAGGGYFTEKLAARVGDDGKVYANDIENDYIDYMRTRFEKDGFDNIELILGEELDPLFPKAELDAVVMVHVYHHLSDPVTFLRNIRSSLKGGAYVAVVAFKENFTGPGYFISTDRLKNDAQQAGYELVEYNSDLKRDNVMILKPIGQAR